MSFLDIAAKVEERQRLSAADALVLLSHPNLTELGLLADRVRQRFAPDDQASYSLQHAVVWLGAGDPDQAARLAEEEIRSAVASGAMEICLLPATETLSLSDWLEGLQLARSSAAPPVTLSTPASTVLRLAHSGGAPPKDTAAQLKAGGLDLVGPEVGFDTAPLLNRAGDMIEAHLAAHRAGLPSVASLPAGGTVAERASFLLALRQLQDETGVLLAAATGPAVFRSGGDPLAPAPGGRDSLSAFRYLQFLGTARLMLDNVPHLRAAWETQGLKIGQVALRSGADDLGSAHGAFSGSRRHPFEWTPAPEEMERQIRDAGLAPQVRNGEYEVIGRRPPRSGTSTIPLRVLE